LWGWVLEVRNWSQMPRRPLSFPRSRAIETCDEETTEFLAEDAALFRSVDTVTWKQFMYNKTAYNILYRSDKEVWTICSYVGVVQSPSDLDKGFTFTVSCGGKEGFMVKLAEWDYGITWVVGKVAKRRRRCY
jgi:hypothetical protein